MTTCLLLLDFQRAFLDGIWARHFGLEQVKDIQSASEKVSSLFKSGSLRNIQIICSRCYLDSPDQEPPDVLKVHLANIPHVWKPTMNIMLADGFSKWLDQRLSEGVRQIVIGGCTTTSCVRVSSQAIQAHYGSRGLQVIVDRSICGARSDNYDPDNALEDPVLLSTYGNFVMGRSAVDLAILQMEASGVKFVDEFDWSVVAQ